MWNNRETRRIETVLNEDLYVVYIDYDNAISYQWFMDDEPIDGANEVTFLVLESGTYFVEFITENGCYGISNLLDVVKCDENFVPSLFVSDFTLLTTDTEYELEWFWNGVDYGSGPTVEADTDGYYWLIASDEFGCFWSSDTIFFQSPIIDDIDNDGIDNDEDSDVDGDGIINSDDDDVDGDGIPNDIDNDIDGDGIDNGEDDTVSGFLFINELLPSSVLMFPNPSGGVFYINCLDYNLHDRSAKMIVRDIKGKLVFEKDLELKADTQIDISFLSPSMYSVKFYIDQTSFSKNIVIH